MESVSYPRDPEEDLRSQHFDGYSDGTVTSIVTCPGCSMPARQCEFFQGPCESVMVSCDHCGYSEFDNDVSDTGGVVRMMNGNE